MLRIKAEENRLKCVTVNPTYKRCYIHDISSGILMIIEYNNKSSFPIETSSKITIITAMKKLYLICF